MLTIEQALLEVQAPAARHKVAALTHPGRFLVSGMLAGAYIGVGVVLMVSAAGPLTAAGSGWGKLVGGIVFGVALTFVVIGGGELVTSSMMTLPQGVMLRAVAPARATVTLIATFAANLVGAVVFGTLVAVSGVLHSNPAAGTMLADMLAAKAHEGPVELFVRGALCNLLVCLAIWMCARLRTEGAKIVAIFCAIVAFLTSGFEHVVANMTTYTIGLVTGIPEATWDHFGANMLWVGLGNLFGGAVLVGLAYWLVGGSPRVGAERTSAAEAELSAH